MADDQKTEPIKYWKITAPGVGTIGMFNQCGLPSMSLQAGEFKVWDEQGKPDALPTGVQASFGDVTLSRGVDDKAELWKWISKIAQKGANPDTVKEVSLMACNADGGTVQEWKLTNAFPSSYSAAGMAAGGSDVLTEQISIRYTDAQLGGQGGLTGGI
jgi:phage tail-like protein